jgi:hypothetical protein
LKYTAVQLTKQQQIVHGIALNQRRITPDTVSAQRRPGLGPHISAVQVRPLCPVSGSDSESITVFFTIAGSSEI